MKTYETRNCVRCFKPAKIWSGHVLRGQKNGPGGLIFMSSINFQGQVLESAVCPLCPGSAKIAPPSALEAHLAKHRAEGTTVHGPGGLTRNIPGREVHFRPAGFRQHEGHGISTGEWFESDNLPTGKHYHLSSEKKEGLPRSRTDQAWLEKVYGGKDLRR